MKLNMKFCAGRRSERGNVLFLILIAVILFAALSYAVTSSSRSGGGDASSETTLVNSAQITQYPASVRTAIVRMIVGGRLVDDIVFDRPSNFAAVTAADAESDTVFHPQGGGATSVLAPSNVMEDATAGDWFFSSEYQIENVGTTDIGGSNSANDLIAFLPGVSKAVCLSLNEQLGIVNTTDADSDGIPDGPTAIPADDQDLANAGIGAAADAAHAITDDFSAQPFGCYDAIPGTANGVGQNVYYHVLIER